MKIDEIDNNIEKYKSDLKFVKSLTISFIALASILGALFCYLHLYLPLSNVQKSAAWESVPATVVSSEIGVKKRDSSSFNKHDLSVYYSIKITYQYEYNGKTYFGDRYDFFRSKDQYSTFGKTQMQEITKQYPRGKKFFCWINPQNPGEAVISRDIHYISLLLSALVTICVPGLAIFLVLGKYKNAKKKFRKEIYEYSE